MEYRKLISFGKSSYVISLPKSWVSQHLLKKGDLVYLEQNDHDLVLSPTKDSKKGDKEITISVDGKSIRRIQREVITSYIKDYKTIILTGKEIKDKAKDIQDTIHNLMALEVMEQTSNRIVAKDFLDMENVSIFNLIRKIDVIIRAMMDDCEKMFEENNYESIHHRDNDINRLSFLVFRIIEYGLENSSVIYKKFSLKNRDLLGLWWFVFNLEAIGDDVKRISRHMTDLKLDQKNKDKLLELLAELKLSYLKILKGFYNHDVELVHEVLETKNKLIDESDILYSDTKKVENMALLVGKMKSMVSNIHNLGRVVYQHEFTFK